MAMALSAEDFARRVRTIRHESAYGRWELARCRPAAALRPYAIEYQGYREAAGPPVRRREMPNGNVALIVNFGAEWRIGDGRDADRLERFGSFVGGVDDVYALSESTGGAYCMQVDFTPIGASLFLRAGGRDLARRVVGFSDVLGGAGRRLAERLHDLPDWPSRFAHLEAELAARILPLAPDRSLPAFVWERIVASAGGVGIAAIAGDLGVSRKHLSVTFREAIGVAPKTYARLCRFRRAAAVAARPGEPDWAGLALDCGYYDQAHFNRDFRAFSGYSPTEYRRHALRDGTGVLDA